VIPSHLFKAVFLWAKIKWRKIMELDFEISEKKLEEMIYNQLIGETDIEELPFGGIAYEYSAIHRQLDLGHFGIADIVAFSKYVFDQRYTIDVFELKKGKLNWDSLAQVIKYANGLRIYVGKYCAIKPYRINMYLIGGSVLSDNSFEFITKNFPNINIITYELSENGVSYTDNTQWWCKDLKIPKKLKKILTCVDLENTDDFSNIIQYFGDRPCKRAKKAIKNMIKYIDIY
jgi:hypothetical protein